MAAKKKKKAAAPTKEKEPDFMVQISDPKLLRKDVLEALREVIIFMQGYEKFRKIQEEKVAIFSLLRSDIKDLNRLVDQLRHYFPKGKLRGIADVEKPKMYRFKKQRPAMPAQGQPQGMPAAQPAPAVVAAAPAQATGQLDELEAQLQDIEGQLKGIR